LFFPDILSAEWTRLTASALPTTKTALILTLIRWMLSLTPAERLEVLQQYVDSVLMIRAWNSE
jgi:hypothetical protein